MPFIDKSRLKVIKLSGSTTLYAPNFKISIFPESILELKRLCALPYLPQPHSNLRFVMINKTFKLVTLSGPNQSPFFKTPPNSMLSESFLRLDASFYTIKFQDEQ